MVGTEKQRQREAAIAPMFAMLKARGHTKSWFARQLGLSPSDLHAIEHGKIRAPAEIVATAEAILGVNPLDAYAVALCVRPAQWKRWREHAISSYTKAGRGAGARAHRAGGDVRVVRGGDGAEGATHDEQHDLRAARGGGDGGLASE